MKEYRSLLIIFFLAIAQADADLPLQDQGVFLEDYSVEMNLRFEAIAKARTVDLATWSQPFDGIGQRLAIAVREALKNKARVRIIYESFPSEHVDPVSDTQQEFLKSIMDQDLPVQAMVYSNRWSDKFWGGLEFGDFFHEKFILIDRGLPTEKIFIGGRSHHQFAADTADSGIVIIPGKHSHLGIDLQTVFESMWQTSASYQKLEKSRSLPIKTKTQLEGVRMLQSDANSEPSRYTAIRDWLFGLSLEPQSNKFKNLVFTFDRLNIVHHNLIQRVLKTKARSEYRNREVLGDPIIDELVVLLDNAKERIAFTSYTFSPPKKLSDALLRADQRGVPISFFTNGKAAHERYVKGALPHFNSLEFMQRFNAKNLSIFVTQKSRQYNNFVYSKNADVPVDSNLPIYLHHKIFIIDDWVAMGSHNYTMSNLKNDELQVFMQHPDFADYLYKRLHAPENVFTKVSKESFLNAGNAPWYFPLLRDLFLGAY